MSLLQSIKNFFAPHQPKQEPVAHVTSDPLPVVEIQPVLTLAPEPKPVEEVKVTTETVREEVKASAPEAWPFPVKKPAEGKKVPVKKTAAKATPVKKAAVTPTKKKPAARTTSKKK